NDHQGNSDCSCSCDRSVAVPGSGKIPPFANGVKSRGCLVRARSALLGLGAALVLVASACNRRDLSRPLIVVLVPSQDNPIFKSEADAAADAARSLGYRVRVDAHDDDAYKQDNLVDAAIASNAAAVILDNAGADSSIAAVRRATVTGIPFFLIDREIMADGI